MTMYDFPCEYCTGTVRECIVDLEPIKHHRGIVVLEEVPIGVCDRCGAHYYAAPIMRRVESILTSGSPPDRTIQVPVERYRKAV
ncbi:MAG: YgiT-type zinc finger protein [Phycisphaerales bacterium]|nr:YgiT-type zinc finger protein [Phycisphaerales bacterium]MCI0629355.1 YgiT-type zinc finger protein [Phycisphaerales bacterium]MCI0674338.1 YgiT-type zinc finger protein [Phycisphaerales bacterium]